MRRVTREDRLTNGKLTNNQVTRWVGSRQLTWEHMAHRKLRQKPCAHTKQKHKHMASKTNSPAMCKTGHEHAANEKTHKPLVHTRHDNMKACSQWNTQAACHTPQDTTWIHGANKATTKHTWTEEHAAERTRDRTLTWDRTHSQVSEPWHETKTQDMSAGIWTPCSNTKQGTQTRQSTPRARSKLHAHVKTGHDGSVRALSQNPWMTPDRSDRTLTDTSL